MIKNGIICGNLTADSGWEQEKCQSIDVDVKSIYL